MSFINVANAEERTVTVQNILNRFQGMSTEEAQRVYTALQAQNAIEAASNPSNIPVSGNPEAAADALKSALASKSEIVKANLTAALGFNPTQAELTELTKFSNTLGSTFATTMTSLGNVVTQVEGGINAVLQGIDQGISAAITNVVSEGQRIASEAAASAQSALQGLLPNTQSLIPPEARAFITDLTNIPNVISDLTNSVASNINSAINDINKELNAISTDLQTRAVEFIDSNITGPVQNTISQVISSTLTVPPVPPTPTTPTGEPYPAAGGTPQPEDNPAPIRGSVQFSDSVEESLALLRIRALNQQLEERARQIAAENRAAGI